MYRREKMVFSRWPDGEPIMVCNERVGTRFVDGTMLFAPGLNVEIVDELQCKQPIKTYSEHNEAAGIQNKAQHAR
jgi:hypothetical protein